jgi:hypothetical protein
MPTEVHLTIVFAALAVLGLPRNALASRSGRFVQTARRYRIVQINAGVRLLIAEDPTPDDLRDPLAHFGQPGTAHQFEPSRACTMRSTLVETAVPTTAPAPPHRSGCCPALLRRSGPAHGRNRRGPVSHRVVSGDRSCRHVFCRDSMELPGSTLASPRLPCVVAIPLAAAE